MKNPAVIGFYGESGTGKTTLIVKLIKILNGQGFNVSVIKIADNKVSIDTKGKDTWKYAEAGASLICFSSGAETDFIIKNKKSTKDMLNCIKKLGDFDLILIEGANDKESKKIRLGKIKERKNTIMDYNGDFEKLLSFIKKEFLRRK